MPAAAIIENQENRAFDDVSRNSDSDCIMVLQKQISHIPLTYGMASCDRYRRDREASWRLNLVRIEDTTPHGRTLRIS